MSLGPGSPSTLLLFYTQCGHGKSKSFHLASTTTVKAFWRSLHFLQGSRTIVTNTKICTKSIVRTIKKTIINKTSFSILLTYTSPPQELSHGLPKEEAELLCLEKTEKSSEGGPYSRQSVSTDRLGTFSLLHLLFDRKDRLAVLDVRPIGEQVRGWVSIPGWAPERYM